MEHTMIHGQWEETGDTDAPWSRLSLRHGLNLDGYPLHVEAYAVDENGDAVHPFVSECLEGMMMIYPETVFQPTTINGRDYVICAFPHQR